MNSNLFLRSFQNLFTSILHLDESLILQAATNAQWLQRSPRKIDAVTFLNAICYECVHGTASYNDIASRIDLDTDNGPSKQAIAGRMNSAFQLFIQDVLAQVLREKLLPSHSSDDWKFLESYQRVIIQDSTVIKLPAWLFPIFSGVSNGNSKVCNARIQAVYDIKNMSFLRFSIDSYSKNDLVAAPELEICKGDLVLRDRGYLTASEITRHTQQEADCIYRHKTGTQYLDAGTHQPIDLLALLKANGHLDINVRLNTPERSLVRIVCAEVPEETANLRRMKAKKEVKGHNPSKAVLALMDWTIFITTIPREKACFQTILRMYGLRWRIENLFKTWKSHMNFAVIHRVSVVQLRIYLTARLLMITICTNLLYWVCWGRIRRGYGRDLSLEKFLNYLKGKPEQIGMIVAAITRGGEESLGIWESLKKYCCYDKRKRPNFLQMCLSLP